MNFPFLTIIVLFATFTYIFMKKTSRKADMGVEKFMENERAANNVRKQPLTDLEYINVDLSKIPVVDYTDEYIEELITRIQNLSDLKIVNLSGISNTDLKLKYGVANLPLLTEYDQNFTTLCRTLFDYGKKLSEIGEKEAAILVLEYGIACNTDLKSHYILLADLYGESMQYKKIQWLIGEAQNMKSILRDSLIKELSSRLEDTAFPATAPDAQVLENVEL